MHSSGTHANCSNFLVCIHTVIVATQCGNSSGNCIQTEVINIAEPTPSVSLSRTLNMMNIQPDGMEAIKLCIYKNHLEDKLDNHINDACIAYDMTASLILLLVQ